MVVAGAWTKIDVDRLSEAEDKLATLADALSRVCNYYCRECSNPDKHDIVTGIDTTHESSHLETCNLGTCDSHESCEPNFATTEWLTLQVLVAESSSMDEIEWIIERLNGRAYLNVRRGSLQVLGCDDRPIANIPLQMSSIALSKGAT